MCEPAINFCRVCGVELDFAPWGEDGRSPTFYYCPCCGTEFGIQDACYEEVKVSRRRWLESGARWKEPEEMPADWVMGSLAEQLERVLPDRDSLDAALQIVREARERPIRRSGR